LRRRSQRSPLGRIFGRWRSLCRIVFIILFVILLSGSDAVNHRRSTARSDNSERGGGHLSRMEGVQDGADRGAQAALSKVAHSRFASANETARPTRAASGYPPNSSSTEPANATLLGLRRLLT